MTDTYSEKHRHDCEVRYWRKLFHGSDFLTKEKYINTLKTYRSPHQFKQLMSAIFKDKP